MHGFGTSCAIHRQRTLSHTLKKKNVIYIVISSSRCITCPCHRSAHIFSTTPVTPNNLLLFSSAHSNYSPCFTMTQLSTSCLVRRILQSFDRHSVHCTVRSSLAYSTLARLRELAENRVWLRNRALTVTGSILYRRCHIAPAANQRHYRDSRLYNYCLRFRFQCDNCVNIINASSWLELHRIN